MVCIWKNKVLCRKNPHVACSLLELTGDPSGHFTSPHYRVSSPSANKLPSVTAKYFRFLLISPEHLLPFFCTLVPMFLCIVESLGLVSTSEVWFLGQ